MEGLGIDPIQLGAQIVNVGILVYLLKRFLYLPILSSLDKRKNEIQEALSLKEAMVNRELKMAEEQKKLRKELHEEERRVMKQAVTEAKKRENEILGEAKKEIIAERDKMLADMSREREKIIEEAKKQSLFYAVQISEKLLGSKLDEKEQKELLKKALTSLGNN